MDVRIPEKVTKPVREEVGDGLRTMGLYSNGELVFGYLREDVDTLYTEEDYQRISELFVFEAFDSKEAEAMFRAGEIEYIVYGLAQATVYQYVDDPLGGFFFSVDASANPGAKKIQELLTRFVDAQRTESLEEGREPVDDLQELFLA